jgi:uncharacterized protein YeaO (DUF488 family)
MTIRIKRVYEPRSAGDGYRVLVDRLWPRGVSRATAAVDLWLRDIAPSTALRKEFNHEVDRWPAFRERYEAELAGHTGLLDLLRDLERHHGQVTLLYAARDQEHNEAAVLADVLRDRTRSATSPR